MLKSTGGTAQTQNISNAGGSSATESATLENTVLCNQMLFVMLETNLHLLEIITHSSHCFRKSPSFSSPTPGCPVSSLLSYGGGLGGLPGKVWHFLGNFNPVFGVGEECISQTPRTLGVKSLCITQEVEQKQCRLRSHFMLVVTQVTTSFCCSHSQSTSFISQLTQLIKINSR